MKHLTITYDGITLFDADVDECQWSDSAAGVAIKGISKRPNGGGGGGRLEMLTSGSVPWWQVRCVPVWPVC